MFISSSCIVGSLHSKLYESSGLHITRVHKFSNKTRSHLQIRGPKRVPILWSNLWTVLLSDNRKKTAVYCTNHKKHVITLCVQKVEFLIFCYFVLWPTNAQLFHKWSHSYNVWHYRVILRQPVINTLPSYTSISYAAVGNTITINLHKTYVKHRNCNNLWNNCAFVGHSTK